MSKDALRDSLVRRYRLVEQLDTDPELRALALARAAKDCCWWFDTFGWTYDPRGGAEGLPAYLPFDLFPRQAELIRWLDDRVANAEEGLVEKSRDVGWTWVAAGYALHKWLFTPRLQDHLRQPEGSLRRSHRRPGQHLRQAAPDPRPPAALDAAPPA